MNIFKKILAWFIATLMVFSITACNGEYEFAVGGGTVGGSSDGDYTPPVLDNDPTNDFTVTLRADGKAYTPRMEMYARWSDGFSIHTAAFDKTGVARIDGLDGDYHVTLSDVPNEYTYDPNTYIATNDNRNLVLDLYTLNRLSGGGTGLYDCYKFSKTGVYCAVVESADDAIYFEYAPDGSGTYSIESWADTTADIINPYVEVYIGSSQWKQYVYTTDDGGTMGSYTINFLHTVQIAKENISTGGGGQAVYTFAIKADSKNHKYPITITFAVKRDGNFELGGVDNISGNEMVVPTFDFSNYNVADHEYGAGYTLTYPEYLLPGTSNTYVFDQDMFKLWEIDKGGDGFYHLYDKEKYVETDGYGPILYANITTACRFIDRAFSKIEYNDKGELINSALRCGKKNYKHFIEGYTFLATHGNINGGSYYCNSDCTCHDIEKSASDWACTGDCSMCKADCRRIPAALIGHEGYQGYANSKGLVAVTEELRDFINEYVGKEKGSFFNDGVGSLEKNGKNGKHYQAKGDSGWLIACAYYEKN